MPRYELMYILNSTISDDQVPQTVEQIKKTITDLGASDIEQTELGKKKLAYPIKKTRNGFYIVDQFTLDGQKLNDLDAKLRTQDAIIIRHLIVNLDEHLARLAKDEIAQSKLSRRPQPIEGEAEIAPPVVKRKLEHVPELTQQELDEKIEQALTDEDIIK